jgi:hypothetical protein
LVRLEVETALTRDIPVIPVLISNAVMPKATELPESLNEFSFRNAASVDSGRNFDHDIARLMRSMDEIIEENTKLLAQEEAKARQEKTEREKKRVEKERAGKERERVEQKKKLEQEKRERRERKAEEDEQKRQLDEERKQTQKSSVSPTIVKRWNVSQTLGLLLILSPLFAYFAFRTRCFSF